MSHAGALCTIYREGLGPGPGFSRLVGLAQLPAGSARFPIQIEGTSIPYQRNQCIREACAEIRNCEFVLFMDSDNRLHDHDLPDLVQRLLEHDRPVIAGKVLQRGAPFHTNAFLSVDPPVRLERADLPKSGLVKVAAVGAGLMFVRRAAWEAVGDPWFRAGQFSAEHISEDLDFTWRCTQAGLEVCVDASLAVGHDVRVTVWPGEDNEAWLEIPGTPAPLWLSTAKAEYR